MGMLVGIGRMLAGYLTRASRAPYSSIPTDNDAIDKVARQGDALLVEGRQRISVAIKYLTQSTWSHAALCVEAADRAGGVAAKFVEADAVEGVQIVESREFEGLHARICRPVGLSQDEVTQVTDFALSHVGDTYDLSNVVDLARFFFANSAGAGILSTANDSAW